jgi:hypothetical protein
MDILPRENAKFSYFQPPLTLNDRSMASKKRELPAKKCQADPDSN